MDGHLQDVPVKSWLLLLVGLNPPLTGAAPRFYRVREFRGGRDGLKADPAILVPAAARRRRGSSAGAGRRCHSRRHVRRRKNPTARGLPRRRPSALVCALRFAGGGFIGAGAQAHLRCRNGAGSTWTDTISSVKRPALGVECTVRSFGTLEALRSFSYLSCHSKVISLTFYDQRVPSWSELKLGVLGTQQ